MVNFQSDEALKIPISDITKQLILEKRERLNEIIRIIWQDNQMTSDEINLMKARLISLFMELQEHIKRHYPKKYEEITNLKNSQKFSDLDKCRETMEEIIYDIVENNKGRFY